MGDKEMRRSGGSEYRRVIEAQRRYSNAKKEARLLKQGTEGANRGGSVAQHPWVQSSMRAKTHSERTAFEGGRRGYAGGGWGRRWLPIGGAACLVIAVTFILWAVWGSAPADVPEAEPGFTVWHDLEGAEREHLLRLAQEFGNQGVRVDPVYQQDLAAALRRALLVRQPPAAAIVEQHTAVDLAMLGALVPMSESSGGYIPLAEPTPWTRPLTVVALRATETNDQAALIREFAHFLQQRLQDRDD